VVKTANILATLELTRLFCADYCKSARFLLIFVYSLIISSHFYLEYQKNRRMDTTGASMDKMGVQIVVMAMEPWYREFHRWENALEASVIFFPTKHNFSINKCLIYTHFLDDTSALTLTGAISLRSTQESYDLLRNYQESKPIIRLLQ